MNDGGFDFYLDEALTARLGDLLSQHDGAAFPTSNDFQLWLGSPQAAKTLVSGSGNLTISVADAASGSGYATTAVKLATTQGGLGAGGQTLSLGAASLAGGSAAAFEFWVRVTDTIGDPGYSNELSLNVNSSYVIG